MEVHSSDQTSVKLDPPSANTGKGSQSFAETLAELRGRRFTSTIYLFLLVLGDERCTAEVR